MRHLARTVVLLASLSLAATGEQPKWQGSWAASVGYGGVTAFTGTWSAVPGQAADMVAGTWSLQDQRGSEMATGTWAAGKEGKVWKGTWQARCVLRPGLRRYLAYTSGASSDVTVYRVVRSRNRESHQRELGNGQSCRGLDDPHLRAEMNCHHITDCQTPIPPA